MLYLPVTRRLWIKKDISACQCGSFMVSLRLIVDLLQSSSWESSCHVGINSGTNSIFNHTVSLFLCYKYSNYHRSTEIKVYSSDINSNFCVIDQKERKELGAENDAFIDYIVSPPGSDKWLLKKNVFDVESSFNRFFQIHWFIQ